MSIINEKGYLKEDVKNKIILMLKHDCYTPKTFDRHINLNPFSITEVTGETLVVDMGDIRLTIDKIC